MIQISFDPSKDRINRQKHGISLEQAAEFDMDSAWVIVDDSQDYGEVRYIGIGWLRGNLYTTTFTLESGLFRIINLRPANNAERNEYAENA